MLLTHNTRKLLAYFQTKTYSTFFRNTRPAHSQILKNLVYFQNKTISTLFLANWSLPLKVDVSQRKQRFSRWNGLRFVHAFDMG